jgi:hypothetical protein
VIAWSMKALKRTHWKALKEPTMWSIQRVDICLSNT